jgi:hypothetical protein
MFRVDQRYNGQGLWCSGALPMSIQAALGRAKALEETRFADDVRIVPTRSEGQFVDLRV